MKRILIMTVILTLLVSCNKDRKTLEGGWHLEGQEICQNDNCNYTVANAVSNITITKDTYITNGGYEWSYYLKRKSMYLYNTDKKDHSLEYEYTIVSDNSIQLLKIDNSSSQVSYYYKRN